MRIKRVPNTGDWVDGHGRKARRLFHGKKDLLEGRVARRPCLRIPVPLPERARVFGTRARRGINRERPSAKGVRAPALHLDLEESGLLAAGRCDPAIEPRTAESALRADIIEDLRRVSRGCEEVSEERASQLFTKQRVDRIRVETRAVVFAVEESKQLANVEACHRSMVQQSRSYKRTRSLDRPCCVDVIGIIERPHARCCSTANCCYLIEAINSSITILNSSSSPLLPSLEASMNRRYLLDHFLNSTRGWFRVYSYVTALLFSSRNPQ